MTEFIPRSLTDVVVYLLPGSAIVLATMFTFATARHRRDVEKLGVGELTFLVACSYLLGMILFRVSEVVVWPLAWWFGKGVLEGIIADFPNSKALCDGLQTKVGVTFDTTVECYRFASQVVHDRVPRSADAAERLLALSLMARSLLLVIPAIAGLMIWRFRSTRYFWGPFAAVSTGIALEGVFAKMFLAYWSGAVWRVLRAYTVWRSFGQ